ncbi:hypothetical protein EQV77_10840 [Halobacillus fulvus]|nr:hypothetical protein EQV77_10840 [Halobacillus fulvus]
MFYAYDQNGLIQSLFHFTAEEIEHVKTKSYFCPVCQSSLLVRSGPKVAPHFAHPPKSDCTRGESLEHDTGKWLLYRWMKHQGYEAEIEKYLPDLQQRPDVFASVKGKAVALEFQCATIPSKVIAKRTEQYLQHGIFPFWILGPNLYKRSRYGLATTSFLESFYYFFHHHYHLYFLNPHQKQIFHLYNLRKVQPKKLVYQKRSYPLQKVSFPQLFVPLQTSTHTAVLSHWEKELFSYRTKYKRFPSSEELQFRQYLYLKGHHFSLIPTIGCLPLPSLISSATKPYIWQTRLLVEHFMSLSEGERVMFPSVPSLPTVNSYIPDLRNEYLTILEHLNYVEHREGVGWIKIKEAYFPKNVEEALAEDQQIGLFLKKLVYQEGFPI